MSINTPSGRAVPAGLLKAVGNIATARVAAQQLAQQLAQQRSGTTTPAAPGPASNRPGG